MNQPLVPRILRPRRAAPADAVRPTRADINLEAVRHNVRVVRKHAGDARVWAVLKADAYGHGAPAVARTLERDRRVDGFCVALLEEGVELREAGINAPILLMGGLSGSGRNAHEEAVVRGLVPVVHDLEPVAAFARLVRSGVVAGPIDVHLKIDTGMARLGVTMQALPALAAKLADYPEVRVRGLMTHLACAEDAADLETAEQLARFEEATALLREHGVEVPVRHAASSAAVLRGQAIFDAVRPGLALFGVSPRMRTPDGAASGEPMTRELKAVMRVRTEIVALRTIEAGAAVGYGGTWRAPGRARIATLPMGYADGLSRHLGNRGHVLVRGRRAPIVGAVSMDMAMIDVTSIEGAAQGDEAVILGPQEGPLGRDAITAGEIAEHAGTIPWEVLTSVSRRVPRFYREP
ncbi:MAG TPA: alanine racemase [Polyangiaceae bacterium]|nr:alanine racemase [Polyangiaceae bacterium]